MSVCQINGPTLQWWFVQTLRRKIKTLNSSIYKIADEYNLYKIK